MYEETKQFLNLLFGKDDLVEFRLIKMASVEDGTEGNTSVDSRKDDSRKDDGEKADKDKVKFVYLWGNLKKITSDEFLKSVDDWNNKLYHIFFGPNPRKKITNREKGEKSNKKNIAGCKLLFVDVDPKNGLENMHLGELYEYVLLKIRNLGVPEPSVAVVSGHGYHLYWMLRKSTDVAVWRPYQVGLINALAADTKCKDSTRILRLPGFLNVKKQPYVNCKIVNVSADGIYDLDQFDCVKSAENDTAENVGQSGSGAGSEDDQWFDFKFLNTKIALNNEGMNPVGNDFEVKVNCPFAFEFHDSKVDKTASCGVCVAGEKNGIYHCFACRPELAKGFEKGNVVKLIVKYRYNLEVLKLGEKKSVAWKDLKDKDLQERYWKVVYDLEKQFPGFCKLTHDKQLYSLGYPADNAQKIIEKFFTVQDGLNKGRVAFIFLNGHYYYGYKEAWRIYEILNGLLRKELRSGYHYPMRGNVKIPIPFPVKTNMIKEMMEHIDKAYDIKMIRKGYTIEEIDELEDRSWIDNTGKRESIDDNKMKGNENGNNKKT